MTVKLIYSIISIVLIVGAPICFYLYNRHKNNIKFKFWDVVVGIILEFLCKHVLVNVLINALASVQALNSLITTTYVYVAIDIVLTVILLIVGLFLVKKFYYHGNINLTAMVSLALGMSIADILNSTLMAALSNIVYIKQTMDGTFLTNLLTTLTNEQAQVVISSYEALPNQYYLYIGVITVAMLISNYLTTAMFCHTNMETHKAAQITLIALIVALYSTIYYFTSPTTISYANPLLLIFAGMQLVFAHINSQYMIAMENSKKK